MFRPPVGTEEERNSGKVWPSTWTDATGFLNRKAPGYAYGIHTGADLNWNAPRFDADKLAPVYSIGDGVVTYAQPWPNPKFWGIIIVIDHGIVDGKPLFSRYGHVAFPRVKAGDVVKVGQQIAQIGDGSSPIHKPLFPFHLHFDISTTNVLRDQPQNWPAPAANKKKELVQQHYVDPEIWLRQQHTVNSLPEALKDLSSPTDSSDNKPPRTNILPSWYVLIPEVTLYKDPRTSSQKSGTLFRGKSIVLGNQGARNENMEWGKIVGGTFDGDWVPIRKLDPTDPKKVIESLLSTNPPQ